jgi:hypothetical protein
MNFQTAPLPTLPGYGTVHLREPCQPDPHRHSQVLHLLLLIPSFSKFHNTSANAISPQEYPHMPNPSPVNRISLDTWAVLLAFAAALLVRLGVVKTVPW